MLMRHDLQPVQTTAMRGSEQGTIERAFELARTGQARSMPALRALLIREGHLDVQHHLSGSLIRRQLRILMDQARDVRSPAEA
ncbi:hypothetical protein GCM10023232_09740 [Sphingosinicella ginsenosidimutans]|nr:hypothetical protein [Sphingosinicella ginsenosidimutans]